MKNRSDHKKGVYCYSIRTKLSFSKHCSKQGRSSNRRICPIYPANNSVCVPNATERCNVFTSGLVQLNNSDAGR
jgi:hypothetical protein